MACNNQFGVKKVSAKNANDIEFVKELLNEPREMAIFKLNDLIDMVDKEFVIPYYIKTLPVYFVHAEVNQICLARVKEMITKLKDHPLFGKYQSLFEEWEIRFTNLCAPGKGKALTTKMETAKGTSRLLGYTDLEFFVALQKWLKFHKLHKYTYFFANITHEEFANLNDVTINEIESKVGLMPITLGARGTIIRRMDEELNHRMEKLGDFLNMAMDDETIKKCLSYLKKIFHTPVKKHSELPTLLEKIITLVIEAILAGNSNKDHTDPAIRVLRSAYSCHFFNHVQRSKFNTLRCRLNTIARESNTPASIENVDKELSELSAGDQLLLENLKKIEIALMKMMDE